MKLTACVVAAQFGCVMGETSKIYAGVDLWFKQTVTTQTPLPPFHLSLSSSPLSQPPSHHTVPNMSGSVKDRLDAIFAGISALVPVEVCLRSIDLRAEWLATVSCAPKPIVTALTLSMCSNLDMGAARELTRLYPSVKKLTIDTAHQSPSGLCDMDALAWLLGEFPQLQRVSIPGLEIAASDAQRLGDAIASARALNTICIRDTKASDATLQAIAAHGDGITKLDISNCDVTDEGFDAIARGCTNLREFLARGIHGASDRAFAGIVSANPELRVLVVNGSSRVGDETLDAVGRTCPHLTHLVVGKTGHITERALLGVAEACPHIETLKLSYINAVTDRVIRAFSSRPRRLRDVLVLSPSSCCLRDVDLQCCWAITDASVHELMSDARRTLRTLNVSGCPLISSAVFPNTPILFEQLTRIEMTDCPYVVDCRGLRAAVAANPRVHFIMPFQL